MKINKIVEVIRETDKAKLVEFETDDGNSVKIWVPKAIKENRVIGFAEHKLFEGNVVREFKDERVKVKSIADEPIKETQYARLMKVEFENAHNAAIWVPKSINQEKLKDFIENRFAKDLANVDQAEVLIDKEKTVCIRYYGLDIWVPKSVFFVPWLLTDNVINFIETLIIREIREEQILKSTKMAHLVKVNKTVTVWIPKSKMVEVKGKYFIKAEDFEYFINKNDDEMDLTKIVNEKTKSEKADEGLKKKGV